jgi:hypothetical protein
VDKKLNFSQWVTSIIKNNLTWPQYLDEDGELSKKLAISYFPTNFLLDGKGRIIEKNISSSELENYLKVNLDIRNINDKVNIFEPE